MRLRRLRLSGYRSFERAERVELEELRTTNLIVGPNNVGKSNLVRFLVFLREGLRQTQAAWSIEPPNVITDLSIAVTPAEFWASERNGLIEAELTLDLDGVVPDELADEIDSKAGIDVVIKINSPSTNRVSLHIDPLLRGRHSTRDSAARGADKVRRFHLLRRLVCSALASRVLNLEALRQFRRANVRDEETAMLTWDGTAMHDILYKMSQSADPHAYTPIRLRIERWLRVLLAEPLVRFDVREKDFLLSVRRGETEIGLPLESVGTGVAEIVMLLAFLSLEEKGCVVLLEEPEAHLHPAAVNELISVIRRERPSHQLIITSHSTSLIDSVSDEWRVYRASANAATRATSFRPLATTNERLALLADLGVRPSTLFLADTIVWVEGPSGILYMQRLLRDVREEQDGAPLLEGRDYAFVMFGGSLLRYVSLDAPESLSRCLTIGIRNILIHDQDYVRGGRSRSKGMKGANEKAGLKKDVLRLVEEARKIFGQRAFVLPVREVENLVLPDVLAAAVQGLISSVGRVHEEKPLRFEGVAITGERRFHEELASGARSNGNPLSEAEVETLAQRIADKKTALAGSVAERTGRVFTPDAYEFGRAIVAALRNR